MKQKSLVSGFNYRLKVTLKGSRPPIWRRLEIPGNITLAKLHRILQVAMGWTDSHLHQFVIDDVYYSEPNPDFDRFSLGQERDERKYRLDQVVVKEKQKFLYEYDFGDSWVHEILVEKILPQGEEASRPVCLKGARACPPEDIGGIWGYYDFLEIIADPTHPEHEELREWVGGSFDPDEFDLKRVNKQLAKIR